MQKPKTVKSAGAARAAVGGTAQTRKSAIRLDNNLSYKLSMLNFLMVKATARIYTSKNLNAHQWKVLSVLYAHQPMPASDILKWVTLDKAAISRAVQQLQRLELIERKLHPVDGRAVNISLSERGRQMYARMAEDMSRLQAELLAGLGEKKTQILFDAFSEIEQRLRGMALKTPG
ncbi:MarR family winged helix-turn-helix transcriptional regulator [Ferrovibrio xuzhouensis]|uniref:MarR family winged helix-turn-helix transcriptional regulator n=1 Tax=Ferrovibrio xuzhouensis TaxID=1576914 RepID=A0ABV7VA58_9PROT